MKRTHDTNTMESSMAGPSASTIKTTKLPRKPKSIQACNSCRKHKTRCEILDGVEQPLIICHRFCGTDEGSRDGRILIASAVTMALNMRLNEACELALALRESEAKGDEASNQDLSGATDRARLWLALTNVESL
ncbi:hypothetical protein LENED_002593 [Lentinula edodes]|uniref:Zn(2)-C6 fungal-type domain-containing protein n=1 Tax=Lentinula edodes TaxID=5353 RepID=A0A1Q3E1A5_LENED|nr:hypothetical protein LENED_002593 [Lentinula edodes]